MYNNDIQTTKDNMTAFSYIVTTLFSYCERYILEMWKGKQTHRKVLHTKQRKQSLLDHFNVQRCVYCEHSWSQPSVFPFHKCLQLGLLRILKIFLFASCDLLTSRMHISDVPHLPRSSSYTRDWFDPNSPECDLCCKSTCGRHLKSNQWKDMYKCFVVSILIKLIHY